MRHFFWGKTGDPRRRRVSGPLVTSTTKIHPEQREQENTTSAPILSSIRCHPCMEASHPELGVFWTWPFRFLIPSRAACRLQLIPCGEAEPGRLSAGSDHRLQFIYLKLPQYQWVLLRGPRRQDLLRDSIRFTKREKNKGGTGC